MVTLKNVTKKFGKDHDVFTAVDHINLDIKKGEFIVLIGPSGCGKSTTLKMINHLIKPSSGSIFLNGENTTKMNKVQLRRSIGYVIQNIGLFPHLTIAENITIVPRLLKWPKSERRQRTDELLRMGNLDPAIYRDRYPAELSGGQQQRIGVLRALAAEPDLILMDEPFGALDPITRDQLQDELKELQTKVQKTIIFVTHDMDEALKLADRIVLMRSGKIVQVASPEEMLRNPANDFVREFIGPKRLLPKPETTPISTIMIPQPKTIKESLTLKQALNIMQSTTADVLAAVDSRGRAKGIVTAADLAKRNSSRGSVKPKTVPLVSSSSSVKEAAEYLANGERIILIVDDNNKPVGLVTRSLLIQKLVSVFWSPNSAETETSLDAS